jgi:hypothetical protein
MKCATCYGTGEVVTDHGAMACPDCMNVEWRLRALDQQYAATGGEVGADVQWLIRELRKHREALIQILTRCQDEGGALAVEIQGRINESLGLYKEL